MALHWELGDIEDWDEITDGEEGQKTNIMIWATVGVGLNRITPQNVDTWVTRINYAAENGLYFASDRNGDDYLIPREWVERRIGLWTNADQMSGAKYRAFVKEWAESNRAIVQRRKGTNEYTMTKRMRG